MKELKNINLESERKLEDINDFDYNRVEKGYNEEGWGVSFEYNGYKINGVIDFSIELSEYSEEDTNFQEIQADNVDVDLKEMYDEDENEFKIPVREIMEIQNQLNLELKNQY